MKTRTLISIIILQVIFLTPLFMAGCRECSNPAASYLDGAEFQFEGEAQKKNIIQALNDILTLSPDQLKAKRYADYSGKSDQWDLPTLIQKHFVPDMPGKTTGDDFYQNIKKKEAQDKVREILKKLQ